MVQQTKYNCIICLWYKDIVYKTGSTYNMKPSKQKHFFKTKQDVELKCMRLHDEYGSVLKNIVVYYHGYEYHYNGHELKLIRRYKPKGVKRNG